MPRKVFIHRDTMLDRTGKMPARKAGESNKAFEHRKSVAASEVAQEWGLDRYDVDGSNALRYDQDQVDYEVARRIKKLPSLKPAA